MSLPERIRSRLKTELWKQADELGWMNLSAGRKAQCYEMWTRDPEVGGVLERFLDRGQVRVYIKDTLLKDYGRVRLADPERPYRVLKLAEDERVSESYIKPHGRRLDDGRVFCWGRADDWKSVLMAVHERAFVAQDARPFGVVLMYSAGRYHESHARRAAEDAAKKLGVEHLVWLD